MPAIPRKFRRLAVLMKLEAEAGTAETPAAADALLLQDVTLTPMEADRVERNVIRPYLGARPAVLAALRARVQATVDLAGSGAAATLPPWTTALRSSGMAVRQLAAAHSGTAAAGAASTITLAAGASATADAYKGFRVRITSGTGNGQSRLITGYDGATKVATVSPAWTTQPTGTSAYAIDAGAAFSPVSSGEVSATLHWNLDGQRQVVPGARGTFGIELAAKNFPRLTLDMMGFYGDPSAVALPTVDLTAWKEPVAVGFANTPVFEIDGFAAVLERFSYTHGNTVPFRDRPNARSIEISDRAPSCSITIEAPPHGDKDFYALAKAQVPVAMRLQHGTAAGQIVEIDVPAAQLLNPRPVENEGIAMLEIDVVPLPLVGDDEIVIRTR
jgi:hypothetical protein